MSLPIYYTINLRSSSLEELSSLLSSDLNLKHPVVLNVRNLSVDQQREAVGLIENWYVSNGVSYQFPYPVYVLTDHERTISNLPLFKTSEELPKFFAQKEGKMNVKEAHLAGKNKLLQQEVRNTDATANASALKVFGSIHRQVFELEEERLFCRELIRKLTKGSNG